MNSITSTTPLLTVCIPSYNRARYLGPLLDSILGQSFQDYEILICEDASPERGEISEIVAQYQSHFKNRIVYIENSLNLGYDANIRKLVEKSNGQYCVFMGNDDLMCPDALAAIASVIARQPDCGVIVRTYATFDEDPAHFKQVFRYFPEELIIEAGEKAIFTAYRRSVVIPGMVIHRNSALEVSSTQFDGTLLYQLYLVGMILAKRSVVFTPQVIALRRDGTPPDFGNSASEKGKFVPMDQTTESSIHFMKGMLLIAKHIEKETKLNVFSSIRSDIGNYSYPILSIQATRPFLSFFKYGISLGKLGFWRSPLFHAYFLALLVIGAGNSDKIIIWLKNRLGYTPRLGGVKK